MNQLSEPNLQKIIDTNIKAIRNGRIGPAITHGKSYLMNIIGEENYSQVQKEMDTYFQHLVSLVSEKGKKNLRTRPKKKPTDRKK